MCGLLFKIVGFYAEHQREGNDIVLLSHLSSDLQGKTEGLNLFARQVRLNINTQKTEVMAVSTAAPVPITVG